MEYNYVLRTEYDGNTVLTNRISGFVEASRAWEKCVDSGDAKSTATYIITDPVGNTYTKMFTVKNG
jgi:hypothetical protein